MALSAMVVPTTFTANDKFSKVINTMTRNTNTFSSGLNRMNSRLNNQFNSLNRISQFAIAGGVGALFYKAGEDVIEYEKSIASLAAVTGTVVGSMNKDIESLGKETSRSVIDITKGFELIGSKMSEYLKNPTALREIAKQGILMADASRMSAEDSIDNLTSLLNQFGAGYKDANRFVNKLSAGEDIGASTISETTDILRQFAASARMAGADVEESIALVQAVTKTLGKQGVGRNFRNIMTDLNTGKGMDKNKLAALKMVGIDIKKIINPATTFVDKMRELRKLAGDKQAMGMFFKKTGMEAGATFVRDFATFEKYLKFIRENDTAIAKANKNNATFAKGWQDVKNAFTNYIVTQDKANTGLNIMKNLLGWIKDNMGSIVNLIGAVTVAFIGWKVIVGIVSLVSGIMSAFTAIMSVHRFVVLWATLTNTGYAASLWAVATATLAAYWPLLLIAGVLGLLVYAFWDTGEAADDMVSKQISAYNKGNNAMVNSTGVMDSELQKQLGLMGNFSKKAKTTYKTPWYADNAILENVHNTVSPFIDKEIEKANNSPLFKERVTAKDYKKIIPAVTQSNFIRPEAVSVNASQKENLAGKTKNASDYQLLSELLNVNVNVSNENGETKSVKVNGKEYGKGIGAKTTSTTGLNQYMNTLKSE